MNVFDKSSLLLVVILLDVYFTDASFFDKLTRRGSKEDDDDDTEDDIVMNGPGVYTSGSNVDLTVTGAGGSSMSNSGGDIISAMESNSQAVVVPPPPLMTFPMTTTISSMFPVYSSTPTSIPPLHLQKQERRTPQRRSSSPVTEFIKKTSSRLFGRNKANPSLQDLDPNKMSVPELFAALSSMPPSKFDKIADQLISESLGMGSIMAPPPGFLSSGITGGLGSMAGSLGALGSLGGGLGSMASGSSLLPSLSSSPLLSGGRGGLFSALASSSSPLRSRLPLPSSIMNHNSNNGAMTSSSNVRPMALLPPPFQAAASQSIPNISPIFPSNPSSSQLPFRTVVFPVYVTKDTPLPAISKEGTKLEAEPSQSQTSSATSYMQRPPHLMFGASSHTLDHIHQLMAASSPSNPSGSSSNNNPNLVAPPISHGTSHPINTLHQAVHSGYMHDIGSQLLQPLSFNENHVRPGFGSSTTMTPRRHTTRHWPYPPPIFTAPNPLSLLRGEQDYQGSASDTSAIGVPVDSPPPFESNRNSHDSGSDSSQITKFPNQKSYPILDVSSPDPKVYNAPHDPVEILKVFATAYEKTGPSGTAEVVGPGTKAHVTIIPDGPANIPIPLPRTPEPNIRRELKIDDGDDKSHFHSKTFPVFVKKNTSSQSNSRT
jgi:hypothetical protein